MCDVSALEPDRPFSGLHRGCVVCDPAHPFGLGLRFITVEPGRVRARVKFDQRWNGYPGRLHGGVIASMTDGAMTHALFSVHVAALTAKLAIRYHHSLHNDLEMEVEAWRIRTGRLLHHMEATIHQAQRLCVSSQATFMESDELLPSSNQSNPH